MDMVNQKNLRLMVIAISIVVSSAQLAYAHTKEQCEKAAEACMLDNKNRSAWSYQVFGGDNAEHYQTLAMHQGCDKAKNACLDDAKPSAPGAPK